MKPKTENLILGALIMTPLTLWQFKKVFKLKHFSVKEFGFNILFLTAGLLIKLDDFREEIGQQVIISPAAGSLMRYGSGDESQHIYGRAADIMLPKGPDLETAFNAAKKVGFSGIGVYPGWKPYAGLHLDVRPLNISQHIATWAGVKKLDDNLDLKQVYVSINEVLPNVSV